MDFTLTEEQADLQQRAVAAGEEFREQARAWDESDDAPYRAIFDRMGELGFFALTMPVEHGGQGLTAMEYFLATEANFPHSPSWLCCEPLFSTSWPVPAMLLHGDDSVPEQHPPDIYSRPRSGNIPLPHPGHRS